MRITNDDLFMQMAESLSRRSTCARRSVGCVIVDEYNFVMSTGYNGVARYEIHCIDKHCQGAGFPSGEGLDKCEAVHAEINALMQCKDVMKIDTIYCTTKPCVHCAKAIANTGCRRVVYEDDYLNSKEFGDIVYEQYNFVR